MVRQEDGKSETNLGNSRRLCLKKMLSAEDVAKWQSMAGLDSQYLKNKTKEKEKEKERKKPRD